MLKRNLIANFFGQGWVALMGLAFIPLYIKYLGIEAYGLIGFFALLQAWLSLLDLGMTPTLGREMARFTGGYHTAESIRDLLRSIEVISFVTAAIIAMGIALSAEFIATSWINAKTLPVEVVTNAFVVIGLVTAIRFIESVYRSCIVGLQRQVMFNVLNCTMATLRGAGVVGVMVWVSATIEAFFIWQGLISILTLIIMAVLTYSSLPQGNRSAKFSIGALRTVWVFAGGMLGITLLSMLLTHIDKILLSKLLTLEEYGYYTLAAVVAGAIWVVITPITQAFYPHFCKLLVANDQVKLISSYHRSAQLVSILGGSVAIVIMLFAESLLHLWTQDLELSHRVAPLLKLIALGNMLNSLMWIPYQFQLANGWTSLAIGMNSIALIFIVPATLWATPRFGAEGAAWTWIILNACYILIGIHFMYRRMLAHEKWRWYLLDILLPICAGISAAYLLFVFPTEITIIKLFLAPVVTVLASLFSILIVTQILKSKSSHTSRLI